MKNILTLFLLLSTILTVGQQSKQTKTIYGYNNSRIVDQLTTQQGDLIPERVQLLSTLGVGAMRFPGGTIARDYHIDQPGYDGRGKLYRGKNVVELFIPVVKSMKVPVVLVLNVGSYNTFYWNIDQSKSEEWLDKNKRLIQMFIDSGVPIFGVEVGNEEYLHVPKGQVLPPTWNYNFIQRLLGQPSKDARFRDEVLGYYRMYAEIYKKHVELIHSFGLDAIIPMVNNSNYKWQQWNEIVSSVPGKYGVWHYYEEKPESEWKKNVDSYIQSIRSQGRVPICTEYNAWFGDIGSETNRENSENGFMNKYNTWFKNYVTSLGVPLIMKHRLNGDPSMRSGSSGSVPYDWYRID